MLRELNTYDLEYNRTIPYIKEQLIPGNVLSQELWNVLDFKNGHFFTLLPSNAEFSRLYEFNGGCILPQNKTHEYVNEFGKKGSYTWIPTLINEMSEFIYGKLNIKENYGCVFEDVKHQITDPHIEFFHQHGFLYLDQMYYLLNEINVSVGNIKSAIGNADALWHLLFIVTEVNNLNLIGKQAKLEKIQEFCKKTALLVVGAYDGEGFVLWEPHTS